MSSQSGVACECSRCSGPQWYDEGVCQGCSSDQHLVSTWIARAASGGAPAPAPASSLALERGVSAQLVEVWTSFVLLRGLSPYLTLPSQAVARYRSPPWYRERGVDITVRATVAPDAGFADRLNRASYWTNQSLVVRAVATVEAFSSGFRLSEVKLPHNRGMEEFHHARRLRNKLAHGDNLTDPRLLGEAERLLGPCAIASGACKLDIDLVLEPLWARLLLYARSLEDGASVPKCPGVVVAANADGFIAQTFDGVLQVSSKGKPRSIGDIVSV